VCRAPIAPGALKSPGPGLTQTRSRWHRRGYRGDVDDPYAVERRREEHLRAKRLRDASRVHQLRLSGMPYTQIAAELGLSMYGVNELHREHLNLLRELEALGAADAQRRLQDDRYEALLHTVWGSALSGDVVAIREARMILDSITAREVKVTAMLQRTDPKGETVTTLIAEGSTDEYIEALKRMTA
jgi:hypothetical protein